MKKIVAVGLSGGVDSTLVAHLMMEKGYEVIGLTMYLFDNMENGIPTPPNFIEEAAQIAKNLKIKHHIVDLRSEFNENVITPFVDMYSKGMTPNPCALCNPSIKYGKLLESALSLGADYLATGHYADISFDDSLGIYILKKGKIHRKDQSYMLHSLSQSQLSKVILPLADIENKSHTRDLVNSFMPEVSQKKDSLGICFTNGLSPGDFIKANYPGKIHEGDFVDSLGQVLGKHKGIAYYTIGQKRGLDPSIKQNMFITHIESKNNKIVLSKNDNDTYKSGVIIDNFNYMVGDVLPQIIKSTARICQWGYDIGVTAEPMENSNKYTVLFDKPERAPTMGQSCVFYHEDRVIGGGTIVGYIE